ncbi:glycogen phosphorylase [Synchytrium microbalum]|uniref:Alpha-1,4 glucan phosphorylase n=1 Tax=Synchytrium microbalum TaxID=1806994 RepID=A0A507C532_9FUNG|nr:glycogen phosphorylase [Synchytrium microbalum]TPX34591.1 glycogen phosphorylase [Synchytrium microbalum]
MDDTDSDIDVPLPKFTSSAGSNNNRSRNLTGASRGQSGAMNASPEAIKLWRSLTVPEPTDTHTIQASFVRHATQTLARSSFNMDTFAAYQATAYSVRDRLIERWNRTQQHFTSKDPKRIYYLSLEFLLGRTFDSAILNLNMKDNYSGALKDLGFRVEDLIAEEVDAALGNGGLGRLAACYMDSLATLDLPAWGYGIRYTYGIFQQRIIDGYQVEFPDYWLNFGNPWEVERLDVSYDVRFRGYVNKLQASDGSARYSWEGGEKVIAVAYDYPIPGFGTNNTINIRLWSAKPTREFDFASFNDGNYDKSVEEQKAAENITSVLYPNDNHMVGKILRLKQQYFFVCATLQDIIRRFKKSHRPWSQFSDQVSIQLNDTHPTLSIVELQRILIDEEGLTWDEAWGIVTKTFSFTNHTVLPEALEKWAVPLLQDLLPRHLLIIYDINLYFLQSVEKVFPGDRDRLRRMSIIEEGHPQHVRMAFLAVVGSHTVNGVAALHSELIKTMIFSDFVEFFGNPRFTNVTNGITPRRWLHQANPKLSTLITNKLGGLHWLKHLDELSALKKYCDDPAFQKEWMDIKRFNKMRLAKTIKQTCGVDVSADALFDIQCKRLHEYKRQFMNILSIIFRYQRLKAMTKSEIKNEVPRVHIFAGKSAPGYYIAKLVIKLINSVGDVVNKDTDTRDYLKVVFIPNYNVSIAEIMIPASDISQHISTAGTEASGTSNMKFVLNGGLILGTVDGANIEIGEEVGPDNIWLFGVLAHEVDDIRHAQTYQLVEMDPSLKSVIQSIQHGDFGDSVIFEPLLATLTTGHDFYLISKDFESYLDAQKKVDLAFKDRTTWARKSINAAAAMGKFSADRSIQEYATRIWHAGPVTVPE